ncbi:aminotransferase class V-fold PLP-dependent enzyme [Spirosoma montaniterrae]|uniref:Penicillin epimerase n=1 Tax=Spirosoma montaniterrae TaxID=1178516 RepID=A0A1P9X0A2_9BACT|nr:aminotransferase class V-fold PLP-dependent enzyme [Spirosoma montaniterrae]AQG81028.1 penicillin epimerase [Spirosoma montaniterrae]
MTRTDFLRASLGLPLLPDLLKTLPELPNTSVADLVRDETFWADIRRGYALKPDYINLENGYYCIQPQTTLDAFRQHIGAVNREGSYYMRTRQFEDKNEARRLVAEVAGCSVSELIITRNTTESIDTVIAGLDWKPGDEAVMALQDYGAMLDMFRLQARRYGVVNRIVSVPNHPTSDDELVALYERALTPRTKLLLISHIINITGQILPVKKICAMARQKGVQTIVDGAHALAHIPFRVDELGCDYYASSLHKWLSVPLGAGMLYVRKDRIAGLWPLFGDSSFADDDIRKLNHTGTHPVHTDLAIADAVAYHNRLGGSLKENRLRYLQRHWTEPVRNLSNIRLNTPADPLRACAIANVGVVGMPPATLAKTLLSRFGIWTVAIDNEPAGVQGVRITPGLFTSLADVDALVKALRVLAG